MFCKYVIKINKNLCAAGFFASLAGTLPTFNELREYMGILGTTIRDEKEVKGHTISMAFLFSYNFLSHIDRPHATIKKQVCQCVGSVVGLVGKREHPMYQDRTIFSRNILLID